MLSPFDPKISYLTTVVRAVEQLALASCPFMLLSIMVKQNVTGCHCQQMLGNNELVMK